MTAPSRTTPDGPARLRRLALSAREKRSLGGVAGVVVLLHVVGWGTLLTLVVPQEYHLGGQLFGVGLGVTAYTLGLRHAFDADHIAAIDNTTRKLLADSAASGRARPMTVGFWFSLGHSSVVFVMVALLASGVRAFTSAIQDDGSTLQQVAGLWGRSVAGLFLVLIGVVNLAALAATVRLVRRMRVSGYDERELERHLDSRGLLNRILGRVTRAVTKPWHMYPVGLLFGLGFDTVTEVGLLVVAGGAAAAAMPWWAILTLPVLFAAGMSLLDSLDGWFMTVAYGWAFANPARKVYYNVTVTALSVAVALGVGGVELASVLTDALGVRSGPLAAVGSLDLAYVGYAIAALFVVTWLVALLVWRLARIEERWSGRARPADEA